MDGIENLFEKYAEWNDINVLENANKYPGPTGFFTYILEASLSSSLNQIPKEIIASHRKGAIYIHKLPYSIYIPYCSGHSLSRVLEKGLKTPTVISRPAKHFDTFVDHIANYLITAQHYFTGAQAFSSVEWYAGPYIKNDMLSIKEVEQNIQRLIYNLNYPSRVGMQTPFTNFTIAMDAPKKMLDGDYAFYNGVRVSPLGYYEKEAKLFIIALSKILYKGDAIGQPFTFPIPTIMATADMLWNDPEVFEVVFKTAAKRGSFYWLNTRVVDPDASFAMCCRINIDKNEFNYLTDFNIDKVKEDNIKKLENQRFGGLWAIPDVTGSINVTTINLPRLALKSRDDNEFWGLYDNVLDLIRLSENWFRRRYIKLMNQYKEIYRLFREYLPEFPSSHFNTIGILGLPEAAAIYLNYPKLWFEGSSRDWRYATDLMRKMVDYAVKKAREWMINYGVPWNVEEVPGESAAAKLAIKDLNEFPELSEYLSEPDNPIYSSSIAPYYGSLELPDRIWIEEKVQKSFTGGVMMHIFLGEEPDPEALANLTKKLIKTDLVYWSYTPAITVCKFCGKSFTGLYFKCPYCGSDKVETWSRIIGYYRPLRNWNPFRRREFTSRRHYKGFSAW